MKQATRFITLISLLLLITVGSKAQKSSQADSLEWAKCYALVATHYNAGNLDSATHYAKLSRQMAANFFGKNNNNYLSSTSNLAYIYYKRKQYEAAEPLYLEMLSIKKSIQGTKNLGYALTLNNIAGLYETMGRFTDAEPYYEMSLAVKKQILVDWDADILKSLDNLATIYETNGKFQQSEKTYLEILSICKKNNKAHSLNYIPTLNNLGNLYKGMGEYEEAEFCYKEVMATMEEEGKQHGADYARLSNNIALLYFLMGNNIAAEKMYKQALNICANTKGQNSEDYAGFASNFAAFYEGMGNYARAEELLLTALNIQAKINGTNHADYALCLSGMGSLLSKKGNEEAAKTYFQKALGIFETLLGRRHIYYVATLSSLAATYQLQQDYTKAESIYTEALQLSKSVLGEQHPYHANILNNMAVLYSSIQKNQLAEKYYNETIAIKSRLYGNKHTDYIKSKNDLSIHFYSTLSINNWKNNIDSIIYSNIEVKHSLLNGFSETEKENFLQENNYMPDILQSMAYRLKPANLCSFYESMATEHGWLLQNRQLVGKLANSSDDLITKTLLTQWQATNALYAQAIQLSTEKRKLNRIDTDSLLLQSQLQEKQVIARLPSLNGNTNATIRYHDIAAKLKAGEALVHWTSFKYRSPQGFTDSILYAAYIIKAKSQTPLFIAVFEESQLKPFFKNYHGDTTGRSHLKNNNASKAGVDVKLYHLIWKPLLPHLQNINTIYNIPSGLLNKISFAALTDSSTNKLLIDSYELHQLLSVSELFYTSQTNSTTKSIALFGGADYNELPEKSNGTAQIAQPSYWNTTGSSNQPFGYLEGTKNEVQNIANNAKQSGWEATTYMAINAAEQNLKELSGSNAPKLLHIATHGFYFPPYKNKPVTNRKMPKDYPLLRSGIVLNGANKFWEKDTLLLGSEDGIVTAQEIGNLNLLNTDLIVLSACQTALGDVNGSEGVYGLQRAFKMAGAKKLLMSLWSVPDKETAELMQLFYNNVFKGDNYFTAFRKAQLLLKEKYKDPTKWAGFVLMGE